LSEPPRAGTFWQILQSAIHIDWPQFEGLAALRCTVGVAIPLLVGLMLHQPLVSAFGAIGAVSVGFGSFQGAYRSRAAVMVYAAVAMALSIFVGSLAGHSNLAAIVTATVAAFVSGLLVALGPAAAFVGLQSVVAVLIAGGFPADPPGAALRGAIVLGGGLVQTLLVVIIWPLRRFSAERRAIAAVYRSLGRYASALQTAEAAAPEPHTFAATASPLADPQPFARAGDVLVFQALLDEAERIRAGLAALATRQRQLLDAHPACAATLSESSGRVLFEIAAALESGREPREKTPIWGPLEACARQLPQTPAVDALLGQLRAAWRTTGFMTGDEEQPAADARLTPLHRRPPVRDALTTLHANLTLRSTACRHALRLAVTVGIATAVYREWRLPRGYWMPMTALLVLRPEFHDTFARGLARIAGTIAGAALATLIVDAFGPGPAALTLLLLAFVWGCYAFFRMNYAIFTTCLTGYIVFILMLSGVGEMTAATTRALYTVAGGVLALAVYALWPTWAASTARASLAEMLDAHSAYVGALLSGYADPRQIDMGRLSQIRIDARLARSNAEAIVERMVAEPASRATIAPRAAVGLLAALRRHALGALALHAGLERGVREPVRGMARLAEEMTASLTALAAAVRSGTAPPPLPPLRQTQLALGATNALVGEETDLMVDSINTVASLLAADEHG
jgi:fusaric acid resistance family protein